jgi:hypothetical protein
MVAFRQPDHHVSACHPGVTSHMSIQTILLPLFVQVALTFVVLAVMWAIFIVRLLVGL